MLAQEKGTCSGSDLYFQARSEYANQLLYYLTSCGYYYTDYNYRIERNDYGNFLILYVCNGRLSIRSGTTTAVAGPGQVAFLDCHHPHEYHTIGNTEFIWLHMDGCNTAQMYEFAYKQHGSFVFNLPAAENVKKQLYAFIYAYRNHQTVNEFRRSEKLYALLISLIDGDAGNDLSSEAGENTGRIQEAIRFMEENYEQDISLEDTAAHVNMSKYHFSRLFKKQCGVSPHEFLVLTRLNRAQYLLKTTNLPVKVIAQNVGYRSAATFTNAFIDRVGLSPTNFRQSPI